MSDYYLQQWALWSKGVKGCRGYITVSDEDSEVLEVDEILERVDRNVSGLPMHHKDILKRFFLKGEGVNINRQKFLDDAIQAFNIRFRMDMD